ncbi:hypothetical protein GMST_01760 [Geomonas silvestris]|uniref:Uncharacterized protein n=1 Tax=Geomonas silvestris TaxID=2740184 RepID=A0A6V8MCX7_9BACT|nr:hypothetical protein [Geomonas silvestris]GFO57851.1 hypothetical protein GMST_01760 [Geomonas silvestris]
MSQPAEKVTFKVSAAAAPYIGADKPLAERLKAASGKAGLPPRDALLLVFYLCHDADPAVKRTALETLRGLQTGFLRQLLQDPNLHPRILDLLIKLHRDKGELVPLFLAHPSLTPAAAAFLGQEDTGGAAPSAAAGAPEPESGAGQVPDAEPPQEPGPEPVEEGETPAGGEPEGEEEPAEEDFQSKYQQAQEMGIGDKIKMAMTGDKEWRGLLIKDSNKLVSSAVMKNPRITDAEVLTIAKSAVQNDEILRMICANKEWVKNAQIRKALAENNKTPLPAALRFVATLSDKDLALMAKSKNISSVIASQARRILLNKNKDR